MQRLYSMFPGGTPGVGLVTIRLSVVAAMLPLAGIVQVWTTAPAAVIPLAALAISVLAGAGTPLVAFIIGALELVAWLTGLEPAVPGVVGFTNALALACLGPGRWSVDAVLFGRRTVHLPAEEE